VVFGIPQGNRRVYKLWEEGPAPAVVFELTSNSTRARDLGEKRRLYEEMGVQEYFLFDPEGDYLSPKLQGFRLEGYFYAPLKPLALPDKEWELTSEMLGLKLRSEGPLLHLFHAETEEKLRTPAEEAAARHIAEAHNLALEAELAQLKAELARLKGN
jgi:hypothetical protein